MNKLFKIIGIILLIVGVVVANYTKIPMADYISIAIAGVGFALTIVGVLKSTDKKTWKEYSVVIAFAVGGLCCGFAGLTEDTVLKVITAAVGLVGIILGLLISTVKVKDSK